MCKMIKSLENIQKMLDISHFQSWNGQNCSAFLSSNSGLCEAANFTVSCNGEQKEIKMDFDLVVRNYDSAPINSNDTRCGSNCGRSNLRQMLRRTVTNKVRYHCYIILGEILIWGKTHFNNRILEYWSTFHLKHIHKLYIFQIPSFRRWTGEAS